MSEPVAYKYKLSDAPYDMAATQEWFASIITRELDENDQTYTISPNGFFLEEEAAKYIVPSPTLKPDKRIQIYNQQYWWRLLKGLQDCFPLVIRLFGYHAFNQDIAIPYLLKYPPNHWSLTLLGERLPKWIKEDYKAPDAPLVRHAVDLDWAFHASFLAPKKTPLGLNQLTQGDGSQLLSYTFYLQPDVHLLKWDYDLLAFREIFLEKDVEYWVEHDFPPLAKEQTYHFALYRTLKYQIAWKKLSEGEYALLQEFKKGSTLEAACEVLELDDKLYEQAAMHLQEWLKEWTIRGWLTIDHASA